MARVTYIEADGASHTIEVEAGENVMRAALTHDLPGIVGECGGGLACATCHCYVDAAWTEAVGGPSSQDEADMLECTAAEVKPSSRLSCQIVVNEDLDGLVVHLPKAQY
jgi:ferredoxin, 2Fe-2S